jgi:hypothetical protein
MCRIAQLGFENLACLSTPCLIVVSEVFPLFLPELRVLLSFLLISHPFPHYPPDSAAVEGETGYSPLTRPRRIHREDDSGRMGAGIQRSTPVFHAQRNLKMNTIKKKKRQPLPTDRLVL